MFYKNVSTSVKTFHGTTFNPGETKEVHKFINAKFMILQDSPSEVQKEQKKPSSDKPKNEPPKKEEPKKEEALKVEQKPEEKPQEKPSESAKS